MYEIADAIQSTFGIHGAGGKLKSCAGSTVGILYKPASVRLTIAATTRITTGLRREENSDKDDDQGDAGQFPFGSETHGAMSLPLA